MEQCNRQASCTACPVPTPGRLCDYPLSMVYAPVQAFRALYDPKTALARGTLFSELDLPFEKERRGNARSGRGCGCRCGGKEV